MSLERIHLPPWPQAGDREAELLSEVLQSPHWGGFHPFVDEFERSFAAYQHCAFGIAACNGTVTLEALLQALGIGPGDEVIVPAISFVATATAVSRAGALPVFVDIEQDSFNIDPRAVERAITPQTRAVMAVHFGGTMCEIEALSRTCAEHEMALIEDAAHAHGSEWASKRAGSFGVAGSFSFQNGKALTAGEGGMLVTSDAHLGDRLRSLVNCGRVPGRPFYDHVALGSNFRMTAFQAAVLLAQFERLPAQIALRTASADALQQALADVSATLSWQREPQQMTQNSRYLLVGRAQNRELRDRVCHALSDAAVPCTPFYPHTLYQNELYRSQPCRVTPCPMAERSVQDSFWLGHRALLGGPEISVQIAERMRQALAAACAVQ